MIAPRTKSSGTRTRTYLLEASYAFVAMDTPCHISTNEMLVVSTVKTGQAKQVTY